MAFEQADKNLIVAVFMAIACMIVLGIAVYDAVTGQVDWQRIMLYIATIGFIGSIATLFYMRWRENT